MLGGYLEFFMKPATAELFQSLRRELEELIQCKVSETLKECYIVQCLSSVQFGFSVLPLDSCILLLLVIL